MSSFRGTLSGSKGNQEEVSGFGGPPLSIHTYIQADHGLSSKVQSQSLSMARPSETRASRGILFPRFSRERDGLCMAEHIVRRLRNDETSLSLQT